jgi:integrase
MGRTLHRLSAVKVSGAKSPGYYADGGNLYLRVAPGGSKQWIFRFTLAGKTRDAGLGSFPTISLVKARQEAERCRRLVAADIDPIAARNEERVAAQVASAKAMTFESCAKALVSSHEASWKNAKHRAQWSSTLATYVYPFIGNLPVDAIDTGLVMKVLGPLWNEKPETASRVRGRIEAVLDWAKVSGYRDGQNPAQWRGHLNHLLPAKTRVRKVVHHAALPYKDISTFMVKLREHTSISARALEFVILTTTRTGETLGAVWPEINLDERIWIIPEDRMKGGAEHRVPLSGPAIAILHAMREIRQGGLVFPGAKQGRPLSDMSLLMLLRRMGYGDFTSHGFRSTFRDWCAELTSFPSEVAEMALAHKIPDAVEAAYRRGDLLKKRQNLMDAWAEFCGRNPTAKVAPVRRTQLVQGVAS